MTDRHFILGTAGHIDHGKTALVKALTGVDTDRLKEEKARGLTIDIGFAHMGKNATIIDVPGHEKFIKNMVAGVSTIDLVLLVIAADDGVMPQTREHLEILTLLDVRSGIIVITKIDLVDEEWLVLVQEDIRALVRETFLHRAPIVAFSAKTGEGIEKLRQEIKTSLESLPPRHDRGIFWLPVDRSFVMKGFGTVVTGSVLSGQLRPGETVELLPAGRSVRVRGLQKHGEAVDSVRPGDRAAINLLNIARDEVQRGDVLASPGYFKASRRLHCKLRLLPEARELKPYSRVRLHIGTAEIMARVRPIGSPVIKPGGSGYVQLTLERPIAARRLDPFVIRHYSPARTIGGGRILDAAPRPLRRRDPGRIARLAALEQEDPTELLQEQLLIAPAGLLAEDELAARTGMARETLRAEIAALLEHGVIRQVTKKSFAHLQTLRTLRQHIVDILRRHHETYPTRPGLRKAVLPQHLPASFAPALLQRVLADMQAEKTIVEREDFLSLADFAVQLSPDQAAVKDRLSALLLEQGFSPEGPEALAAHLQADAETVEMLLNVLVLEKRAVRLDENFFIAAERLAEAQNRLVKWLRQHSEITVPQFKELIEGASRKFALPLLNYFDAHEITLREGDIRYPGAALSEGPDE